MKHSLPIAVLLLSAAVASAMDRPNILVILTEDQGAQVSHPAYSQFGSAGVATPNMDALINQGVGFTNAFVSTPVCSASKAALYTGLHGHTNGIRQNTANLFGPRTPEESAQETNSLYQNARIHEELPTLVEKLSSAGYYTGVTHKLHVAQNHQFPYDEWDSSDPSGSKFNTFINNAGSDPWMYFANINNPHQPFITDGQTVNSNQVEVPGHLADTPTGRADWAKYLAGVEAADDIIGGLLNTYNNRNLADDTVVVFLGDHGPGIHRGKMSPHDFGLRTVMSISGPGIQQGAITDALASEVDLMPTLLDLAGISRPALEHGKSLVPVINNDPAPNADKVRDYVVGEVSANKTGPAGHQERSIYDGEHRLIYRHELNAARQVNADLWKDRGQPLNSGNPSGVDYTTDAYAEIASNSTTYKDQFEMLAQVHNDRFNSAPPQFELYHTASDKWEMQDLADNPQHRATWNRLYTHLRAWAHETDDNDTPLKNLWAEGESVTDNFTPFTPFSDNSATQQISYTGKTGDLDYDPDWKTRRFGGSGDFEFNSGVVTAPTGEAVATHDALMLLDGQDFTTSVTARHNGGEAVGVVFGYQDANNYFSFELTGGAGDDVRLRQWSDGTATELLSVDAIADSLAGEFYDVEVGYDADLSRLNLTVTDSSSSIYYLGQHTLNEPLALGGLFGMNSTNAGGAQFTTFAAQTTDVERTLGDFNGDGTLTAADTDLIAAAFGPVTQANAIYNLSAPDNVIDQADIDVWQNRILAVVTDPGPGPGLGEPNLTLVVDPATGQVEIRNDSNYTISFDAYTISSATGADSLDGAGWDSLDDQGGAGWRESPEVAGLSDRLSELNPTDALTLSPGEAVSLGVAFEPGSLEDLLFQFRGPADAQIAGDLNGDWVVDAIDYAIWREGLGDEYSAADYDTWLANFGAVNDLPAVVFDGIVTYASLRVSASQTPEPSCLWLAASLGMLQIVRKPQRQPSAC